MGSGRVLLGLGGAWGLGNRARGRANILKGLCAILYECINGMKEREENNK